MALGMSMGPKKRARERMLLILVLSSKEYCRETYESHGIAILVVQVGCHLQPVTQ